MLRPGFKPIMTELSKVSVPITIGANNNKVIDGSGSLKPNLFKLQNSCKFI